MQVLSGTVAHPDNYEQYFGCFVVAGVLVAGLAEHVRLRWVALAVGAVIFLRSAYVTFRVNEDAFRRLPLTPALAEALKVDPGHTVIDDVMLASLVSHVHPRQGSTPLSYERTYLAVSDRYIGPYRCVKGRLLAERPDDKALRAAFETLDRAYAFGSQDFPFVHLGRHRQFKQLHDVSPAPCQPPDPVPLRYFPVQR